MTRPLADEGPTGTVYTFKFFETEIGRQLIKDPLKCGREPAHPH